MKRKITLLRTLFAVALITTAMTASYSQTSTSFNIETGGGEFYIEKVLALAGSKVGVLHRTSSGDIHLTVYEANGTVSANTDLSSQISWQHSYRYNINFSATATADGNIFLVYAAQSNSAGFQTYNARYTLVSTSGVSIASGQLNSVNATEYIREMQLERLSDGKIVVAWKHGGTFAAFRLFNNNGTPYAASTSFAGSGTTTPTGSIYTMKLGAGRNGNFMISLFDYNGYMRGFLYNNNGSNVLSGGATHLAIDGTVWNQYGNIGIAGLSNGNFAVSWWLGGYNYHAIYNTAGAVIKGKTATGLIEPRQFMPYYKSGSEGYIQLEEVYQDDYNMDNPYRTMRVHRFDNNGDLQSSTLLSDGYHIQPTYHFVHGIGGGYAYVYNYYKSYSVDTEMGGYMTEGDRDTRAATVEYFMTTLPVALGQFAAQLLPNGQASVSWTTLSERNNSYFQVLKSTDGRTYDVIGRVEAKGIESGSQYGFTDPAAITADSYYKLRQYDIDGSYKDLGVRMVRRTAGLRTTVFPNPVKGDALQVQTGNVAVPLNWQLYDAAGNRVSAGVLQQQTNTISLLGIPKGYYLLQIGNEQLPVVKQ